MHNKLRDRKEIGAGKDNKKMVRTAQKREEKMKNGKDLFLWKQGEKNELRWAGAWLLRLEIQLWKKQTNNQVCKIPVSGDS